MEKISKMDKRSFSSCYRIHPCNGETIILEDIEKHKFSIYANPKEHTKEFFERRFNEGQKDLLYGYGIEDNSLILLFSTYSSLEEAKQAAKKGLYGDIYVLH